MLNVPILIYYFFLSAVPDALRFPCPPTAQHPSCLRNYLTHSTLWPGYIWRFSRRAGYNNKSVVSSNRARDGHRRYIRQHENARFTRCISGDFNCFPRASSSTRSQLALLFRRTAGLMPATPTLPSFPRPLLYEPSNRFTDAYARVRAAYLYRLLLVLHPQTPIPVPVRIPGPPVFLPLLPHYLPLSAALDTNCAPCPPISLRMPHAHPALLSLHHAARTLLDAVQGIFSGEFTRQCTIEDYGHLAA